MKITPTFFTVVEGGEFIPWVYGAVDMNLLNHPRVHFTWNCSDLMRIPYDRYGYNEAASDVAVVHSLLFENNMRWDCINGWTK